MLNLQNFKKAMFRFCNEVFWNLKPVAVLVLLLGFPVFISGCVKNGDRCHQKTIASGDKTETFDFKDFAEDTETVISEDKTNAIDLDLNEFLIIKYDNKYGAIQLEKYDSTDATAKWWYQTTAARNFLENTVTGKTNLLEKYELVEKTKDRQIVKDVGSKLFISFDTISIQWSAPNWIYIPENYSFWKVKAENIGQVKIPE